MTAFLLLSCVTYLLNLTKIGGDMVIPVRRMFGGDIIRRSAFGVALVGIVLMMFYVRETRLPVICVVWCIATIELALMIRRRWHWRIAAEWVMITVGLTVVIILFALSWQWTLVLAVSVITTDAMALFTGRFATWHPRMTAHQFSIHSPTKTWEGVAGGVLGSFVISLGVLVGLGIPLSVWTVGLLVLAPIIAVWGDFFESRLKRSVGVKDASPLLGPHGGFVDRLDSIAPVFATVGLTVIILITVHGV